jgi:hypothetical protein
MVVACGRWLRRSHINARWDDVSRVRVVRGAVRAGSIRVGPKPSCKTGETAVSLNAQGPAGPAGISGYQRIEAQNSTAGETSKTVTAWCPSGEKVLGGGGFGDSATSFTMSASFPQVANGLDGYAVYASETDTPDWTLTAVALCASVSD